MYYVRNWKDKQLLPGCVCCIIIGSIADFESNKEVSDTSMYLLRKYKLLKRKHLEASPFEINYVLEL